MRGSMCCATRSRELAAEVTTPAAIEELFIERQRVANRGRLATAAAGRPRRNLRLGRRGRACSDRQGAGRPARRRGRSDAGGGRAAARGGVHSAARGGGQPAPLPRCARRRSGTAGGDGAARRGTRSTGAQAPARRPANFRRSAPGSRPNSPTLESAGEGLAELGSPARARWPRNIARRPRNSPPRDAPPARHSGGRSRT